MIRFTNVTKQYPLGNNALDDVSFEIENNEFVFLVGPSGAGKTTILKMLAHDTVPTSGTIMVDDQEISSPKFHDIQSLRRKIGFVFQDFKVLPEKNVFENISVSMEITGAPKKQIKNEVQETLELVNLSNKAHVFPVQLSAGELQRVAIARAIIGNRDLILADEPTGNLDPKTTWEIMKIFKKLEGEKTIMIATHNTDIVNSLKKRVLALKDGKLVTDKRKGGYEL
jgi:cell division transport system ATP-binding protein